MDKIEWLFLLAFVSLLAGIAYNLWTGSVRAGPFSYRRDENPNRFYLTLVTEFVVVSAAMLVCVAIYIGRT